MAGARDAINFLRSLRDMLAGHTDTKVNLTTKWDGAPAVFCGINPENNKFFVGTKGVFAKNAKLNYTDKDIDDNTAEWLRDMATGHHERRKSVQSEGSIHLKEGVMSDETRLAIYEKIGIVKPDLVNSLDFDTTLYTPEELAHIARYCFDMMHCFDEFGIVREKCIPAIMLIALPQE